MQESGDGERIEQHNKQDEVSPQPTHNPHSPTVTIGVVKDVTSIVQSVVTVIAIVAAGIWFLQQREFSPKFSISHSITHKNLDENWTWAHVSVKIANIGKVRLFINRGTIRVQRILPLEPEFAESLKDNKSLIYTGKFKVEWPLVVDQYEHENLSMQMEYGESAYLYYEFIIPNFLRTITLLSAKFSWSNSLRSWFRVSRDKICATFNMPRSAPETLNNGEQSLDFTYYKQTTNRFWSPHLAESRV